MTLSSPRKGFLDLPGELRNQIYSYETTLPTALALLSTSRQIRAEYTSLHAQTTQLSLPLYLIQDFVRTAFPMHRLTDLRLPPYKLHIHLEGERDFRYSVIDIKRVLGFLFAFPAIAVAVHDYEQYRPNMRDYGKFFLIARQNVAWRDRLVDFYAIEQKLKYWTRLTDMLEGDEVSWYQSEGGLQLVLKAHVRETWGEDKEGDRLYVEELLVTLGLWEPGPLHARLSRPRNKREKRDYRIAVRRRNAAWEKRALLPALSIKVRPAKRVQ